jgi:LysM repeat protein
MKIGDNLRRVFLILVGVGALFAKDNSTPNSSYYFSYSPNNYSIVITDFSKTAIFSEENGEINNSKIEYPMGFNSLVFDFDKSLIKLEDVNKSEDLINNIMEFAIAIYNSKEDLNSTKILKDKKDIFVLNKDLNSTKKVEKIAYTKPKKGKPKKEKIIYVVKKGDSFIKLAKEFNTTVFDIKRWNNIKKRNLVLLGEKLTIYPNKKTPYKKIKLLKKIESYGRYKVKAGDTLSSIVRKFAVGKKETIEINNLKDLRVKVGQKLIIPLSQKKIDSILRKIELKKRAKRLALERKRRLEMARRGKYKLYKSDFYRFKRKIRVVATAYTSHRSQTDNTPFIAAWNNRIRPGMKVIAVSNDLIRKYGITNGTRVRISGLPGVYVVRDKMHPRLRNHIDIYMGTNISKALRWGRRRVILYW